MAKYIIEDATIRLEVGIYSSQPVLMTARLHDDGERRPSRDRDAFSSALVALRTRLRRGDYVLGEPLIIKNLSQALGLSTTPIREALARLSGEGLVEERRGSGYFAPPLGVTELSELYHAHETLVLSVLGIQPLEPAAPSWSNESPHPGPSDGPAELVLTERLFDAIIRQTGNRVVFDAYRRVADRLAPARLVEGRALQGVDQEVRQLQRQVDEGARRLDGEVRQYHRRRIRHTQDIVRLIRLHAEERYSTNIG